MTGAVNVKPVIHGAAVAAGKLNPFPNLCKDRDRDRDRGERDREREKERDRKARFEERENAIRDASGGGSGGAGVEGGAGAGDDNSTSSCSRSMTAVKNYQQQQGVSIAEHQPLPLSLPDGAVIPKDQQTGELPPFGEHKVQQSQQAQRGVLIAAVQEGQENRRLRGKLKWLFEQDRMYWESNSSKSSRRGSPEIDHTRGLKAVTAAATVSTPMTAASAIKLVGDEPSNDAKLLQAVEDSFKEENSKQVHSLIRKPPRQPHDNNVKGKVSKEKSSLPDRTSTSSATTTAIVTTKNPPATTKVPWTFSNSASKFWPRGPAKSRAAEESKKRSTGMAAAQSHPSAAAAARRPNQSSVDDHDRRVGRTDSVTMMSSLDLGAGAERYFSDDFDDGLKSVDSTDLESSEDNDDTTSSESDDSDLKTAEGLDDDVDDNGQTRRGNSTGNVGGAGRGGGEDGRSLIVAKNQAAYLRAKCDTLSREKHDALRKWQKSRREIDEAAKMAQALRTAIETLLEAGTTDSTADFKAKQDILEGHTQALRLRMAKLRRKNSPSFGKHLHLAAGAAATDSPSRSLHDRIETLKRTSEGRSLASPEIPRDTEHKVEALRARLEKLMLATNSRVSDEQSQAQRRTRAQKRPVEDLQLVHHKSQTREEKGELKMKGWLNSLSAELTIEEVQQGVATNADGDYEKCGTAQSGFLLRDLDTGGTPFNSKQGTPSTSKQVSPMHSMHDRDGLPSTEDTKKMVIHKIAEEVRLEAEQWFQVQELLGRVGEDMKSLQEACGTWEKRAILAEAQVACMQEGQEKTQDKGKQPENDKITGLQKEMSRLKETLEDVRNQLGVVGVDPSRWFEAAHNYGYAFMPVDLPSTMSCACKGKCKKNSACDAGCTPDSAGDRWKQKGSSATAGSSANSSTAHSSISSLEKSPPGDIETGGKSQIPQRGHRQSIIEMTRAPPEDEETMTSTTPPPIAAGEVSKYEHPSTAVKELPPTGGEGAGAGGGASGGRAVQDKPSTKVFHKEQPPGLALETSGAGSREDMLLQTQSARERCIVHPDDQLSRYQNFIIAASRRSPLKDVLENIASAKENKRPF